jgi:hypothetical protein
MAFHFENLNEETRRYMLQELAHDLEQDALVLSPRLNQAGRAVYPGLLEEALRAHDEQWLAEQLRQGDYFRTHEERLTPDGESVEVRVPITAAEMLAADEFNRFYMRGLCLRALDEGIEAVEVYRGKEAAAPRPTSEARIGESLPARQLLDDLRAWPQTEPVLGIPTGFNSGLTVRLPVVHSAS